MRQELRGRHRAEHRYIVLAELAVKLATVSDWPQLASCVANSLGSEDRQCGVRLWAALNGQLHELARSPSDAPLLAPSIDELRRSLSENEPVCGRDGGVLIGLHSSGAALGVLEVACAPSQDVELIWHAAPLVATRAALLASTGAGGSYVTSAAADDQGVASVISSFAAQAKRLLDHDRLSAYLVTPDGRAVERLAVATSRTLPDEGVVVPFSDFGLRHILLTNRALVSEDLAIDSRIVGREDRVIAQAGFHGLISVPLRLDGKPFGVLNFVSRTPGFYREDDAPIAQQIADQSSAFFAHLRQQRALDAWNRQAGAERERMRLARELHATLGRVLPDIAERAERLADATTDRDPETAERARHLAREASLALVDTRRGVAALMPAGPESGTVEKLVESELAVLRSEHGVEARFTVEGSTVNLPLAVRRAVHRILQEALSNVRRHARPSRVEVELRVGDDLELRIDDDGVGFDREETAGGAGVGLRFMAERAQSLGGRLTLDSQPGEGTTLTFELGDVHSAIRPLEEDTPAPVSEHLAGVTLRAFIVESHPLLMAGLAHMLERNRDVRIVGHVTDVAAAHRQIARLRPDVLLLDVDADPDGARSLAGSIKTTAPTIKVIGMSNHGVSAAPTLAEQGGDAMVAKTMVPDELVEVIRAVAVGAEFDGIVDPGPVIAPAVEPLTSRERSILALVAGGYTNAQIGYEIFLSTKTIERHVATIITKLRARNRAHACALAVATGIVRLDETLEPAMTRETSHT